MTWYDNVELFDENDPKVLEYAKSIIAVCDDWLEGHFSKTHYIDCWLEQLEDSFYVPIGFGEQFNLEPVLVAQLAKEIKLVDCKQCGVIEDYVCYHSRTRKIPLRERIEYLSGVYDSPRDFSDSQLRVALEKCYKAYRNNIKHYIVVAESDIRGLRSSLKRRKPTASLLSWANHIRHTGGYLLEDYSQAGNISYEVIQKISEGGLEAIFPPEELSSIGD